MYDFRKFTVKLSSIYANTTNVYIYTYIDPKVYLNLVIRYITIVILNAHQCYIATATLCTYKHIKLSEPDLRTVKQLALKQSQDLGNPPVHPC